MSYRVAGTASGIEVRLYQDTVEKIFWKHGELRNTQSLMLETASAPDLVVAGLVRSCWQSCTILRRSWVPRA